MKKPSEIIKEVFEMNACKGHEHSIILEVAITETLDELHARLTTLEQKESGKDTTV